MNRTLEWTTHYVWTVTVAYEIDGFTPPEEARAEEEALLQLIQSSHPENAKVCATWAGWEGAIQFIEYMWIPKAMQVPDKEHATPSTTMDDPAFPIPVNVNAAIAHLEEFFKVDAVCINNPDERPVPFEVSVNKTPIPYVSWGVEAFVEVADMCECDDYHVGDDDHILGKCPRRATHKENRPYLCNLCYDAEVE